MGAGTNRMNDVVVIQASQGLAKYVKECFEDAQSAGVVIGYDGRYNSQRYYIPVKFKFFTKSLFLVYPLQFSFYHNLIEYVMLNYF